MLHEVLIVEAAEAIYSEICRDFESFFSLQLSARRFNRFEMEIRYLSESIKLIIFRSIESHILIARRDSCAILYIPYDLSIFDCRYDSSETRIDPEWRRKIL